jgi:hypothetical protein
VSKPARRNLPPLVQQHRAAQALQPLDVPSHRRGSRARGFDVRRIEGDPHLDPASPPPGRRAGDRLREVQARRKLLAAIRAAARGEEGESGEAEILHYQ